MRLPGGGWAWCGDWVVDHHTPGGTDKDGWQYAKDFPASYHPEPGFTDYVRRRVLPLADPGHVTPSSLLIGCRRRWARRCRLQTSGPWTRAGTTKLLDISLQPFRDSETEVGSSNTLRNWPI